MLLSLLLAACNQAKQEPGVRIAYPEIVASLPMFIAQERGLFSRAGIEPTVARFNNSNDMVSALVAQRLDVLPAVSLVPILHLEAQFPGTVRLFSHSRMRSENAFDSIIVKRGSSIHSLRDLQEKRMGVFPGTSAINMLKAFLEKHGVNPAQVTFIQLTPPNQMSSLESGAIDALFSYEPVTTVALQGKSHKRLFGSVYADLLSPCPIGASVVSRSFERAHSRLASETIEVVDEGVRFMRNHPNEAKAILPRFTPMTPDIARSVNIVDVTLSDEVDVQNIQRFINLLYEIGELSRRLDARELTDLTR